MRVCASSVRPRRKKSAEAPALPPPAPSGPPLRFKANKTFLAIVGSIVLVDQATKFLALTSLSQIPTHPIVPGVFHLTLVLNPGVAFGWFNRWGWIVTAVTFGIVAVIVLSILRGSPGQKKDLFSLALILGGAVGNGVDRVRLGAVVDFLDFRVWPVFNVADSCISVGIAFLLLRCVRSSLN